MVEAKLRMISKSPEIFPIAYQQFRRALVRRFPFAIFFEQVGETINILAIQHTRRLPPRFGDR
jgi:plasmid stabilization system protein ParE